MYMRSTNQTESMDYKNGRDVMLGGGWSTDLGGVIGRIGGEYDQDTAST